MLPISCPGCGGEVEHVTSTTCGTEATGVVECPACQTQWYVAAQMRRLGKVQRASA